MNERIKQLFEQSKEYANQSTKDFTGDEPVVWMDYYTEKFAELIKQAIYDDVKEELIDDAIINEEPDRLSREYLKGCNGGTIDALCHIKNFGMDIEE